MIITAINEEKAEGQVKINYELIKKNLGLQNLPIFFTYIGAFPEYLDYLTKQIVPNLQNQKFNKLIEEEEVRINTLIKSSLDKSEEINDFSNRYKNSPSFYNFQQDLKKIFNVNLKLSFIFVSLREALKGWVVAAKKLPSEVNIQEKNEQETEAMRDKFTFQDVEEGKELVVLQTSNNNLTSNEKGAIEKDFLPKYIFLCELEFKQLMKKDEFWILRVGIEKIILSSIPLLPEKIESPINIFFNLTKKHQNYPELLYLMSEHFPTYAVQRMIFSGFMKNI